MIQVREALFPEERPVVRALFEEYATGLGIDLSFQGFSDELASLPGRYAKPDGGIWLADRDEAVAGCIGLRRLFADGAEIKRLYIRPEFRGEHIGRTLAEHVLRVAAERRYKRIYLDTLPSMAVAIAIYRSLGFTEIGPY